MKKITAMLACMLVCFLLFTGCTNQKDGTDQDTNVGNLMIRILILTPEQSRVPRTTLTVFLCQMATLTVSKTRIMRTAL